MDPSIKQVNNLRVLSNFHSLLHSFNQHSLSTFCVAGSVLGTEGPNTKKLQQNESWTQSPSQSSQDREEEASFVLEVHGQCYSKLESVTDFFSESCTPMFIAALRTQKQPRYPSADKWIRKL